MPGFGGVESFDRLTPEEVEALRKRIDEKHRKEKDALKPKK